MNGYLFLIDGGYSIGEVGVFFCYWDMKLWNWEFVKFVVECVDGRGEGFFVDCR